MSDNYRTISNFGNSANSATSNPLTYCLDNTLDQRFLHGSSSDTYGQNSRNCQAFLSEYCAQGWDGYCEMAEQQQGAYKYPYPNNVQSSTYGNNMNTLTRGELLLHNTAANKYLKHMINGKRTYEPFDPNVASSPMISFWQTSQCVPGQPMTPVMAVDPKSIDSDIVMNKILAKPYVAMDILENIYRTMKREGTLVQLRGTKLGHFYQNHPTFARM